MKTCLTELRTEPFAAEREWTVEGIPVLTAAVELPQPQGADAVSRRIRRYYQAQCKAFLRYCERWLFPQAEAEYRAALAASAPLPCFRAELGYRVTYNSGGLWSLYTQSREVTGHTLLTRRGDTWDLAAGYPVPLSAFFPARSPWRRQLLLWRRRTSSGRSGRGSHAMTRNGEKSSAASIPGTIISQRRG